jgi:hypothetical protein
VELHAVPQNSSNEEYTEDKDRERSNEQIEEEVDENEECTLKGEDDGSNNRKLPLFHIQPIRLFHISLE